MPEPQGEIGPKGPVKTRAAAKGETRTVTMGASSSMLRWNKVLKACLGKWLYRDQFRRNAGRNLRNKEMEVQDLSLKDLEEIEVTSKTSGEVLTMNNVAQVGGNNADFKDCVPDTISTPSFKKHAIHSKKRINTLVRIKGRKSTTLIDCGATDNFINPAFMRKKRS